MIAIHAVARAGARLAPIHPGWDEDQVAAFLETVGPDLFLTDGAGAPPGTAWSEAAGSLPGPSGVRLFARAREGVRGARPEPPAGTDVLLSTSGTTGRPRVVCHSWAGLGANAVAAARRNRFGPGDTWLATLAWAHVGGLAVAIRAAAVGGRIAFGPPRFVAAGVAEALGRLEATHVSLVPAMLHGLLDLGAPPPPTLRLVLLGGASTPPALARRATGAGWPIALTYGLTEMGSQVATGEPGERAAEPGVVGRPLDGVELRIGPEGEIEARGPSRALGILGDPAAAGEWLATGDVGALDARGRLRVTGRRSDRIVSGGTNVDPVEIEAVLVSHPAVREACVVGTPDEVWGEIVTAVVVARAASGGPASATLDASTPAEGAGTLAGPGGLLEWVEGRLGGARRPRRWWWVESLPRTPNGTVDRARIRRAASERSDWGGSPTGRKGT